MVSAVLHAALLLAALSSARGSIISGGGGVRLGDEHVVTLSLAGLKRDRPDPGRAQPVDPMQAMMQKYRAQSADLPTPVTASQSSGHQDLQALMDQIEQSHRPAQTTPPGGGRSAADLGGAGASQTGERRQAVEHKGPDPNRHDLGPAVAAAAVGDLWGQIEPCWRKLRRDTTTPVTLEVRLDARGMIARPPVILRPKGAAPTDQRLLAESRAIQALAGCTPYRGLGALTGEPFKVEFVTPQR